MPKQPLPPVVPGVTIGVQVADRPGTWRGNDALGACDVTILAIGDQPGVRAAAVASLAVLREPGAGHRALIRAVVEIAAGVAVLATATDGFPAGRLVGLSPGQLVTLGLPLARELGWLHARGLMLGAPNLTTEVVVDQCGAPGLLLDEWSRRRLDGTGPATAADDVRALRQLLTAVSGPMTPAQERRWHSCRTQVTAVGLERALRRLARPRPLPTSAPQASPHASPHASPLGARTAQLAMAAAGAEGAAGPAALRELARHPPQGHWQHRLRGVLTAARGPALLLVGAAAVAAIGWATAGGGNARTSTAAGPPPVALAAPTTLPPPALAGTPNWTVIIAELDAHRSAAMAGQESLGAVDVAGSSAELADLRRQDALTRLHLHPVGLAPHLVQVIAARVTTGQAVLRVTDELGSYRLVGAGGIPVIVVAARGPRSFTVELAATPAGWRVQQVAGGSGGGRLRLGRP